MYFFFMSSTWDHINLLVPTLRTMQIDRNNKLYSFDHVLKGKVIDIFLLIFYHTSY